MNMTDQDEPGAYQLTDAFEILTGLINARLALLTGNAAQRVAIGNGARETAYQRTDRHNLTEIQNDIMRWAAVCQQLDPIRYRAAGYDVYVQQFSRAGSIAKPSHFGPFG